MRRGHDVDVLCSANDAVCAEGESADDHEVDVMVAQHPQQPLGREGGRWKRIEV